MNENPSSPKIVIGISRYNDMYWISILVGSCLVASLALGTFLSENSIGAAALFLAIAMAGFYTWSNRAKYSEEPFPVLIIQNGILSRNTVIQPSQIAIKDIQEFRIDYCTDLSALYNLLFIDSPGKIFKVGIFNPRKKDLILLGKALAANPKIENTKEVQGLLRGKIVKTISKSR